jgi:hypothetical protein
LTQEEIALLRAALDDRRLIERDLAELATEQSAGNRDELTLPADEAKLVTLVGLADRATRGGFFGWWWRWRLRAFRLADRAAIEAFAAIFSLAMVLAAYALIRRFAGPWPAFALTLPLVLSHYVVQSAAYRPAPPHRTTGRHHHLVAAGRVGHPGAPRT